MQNNIGFIDNGNNKESHLGMKKLHLNRKGNSFSAKSLLDYVEYFWREISESALFLKECISNSSETEYVPNMTKNALCTLNVIRKNNLNRLICAHINTNSIRNKFDMLASQVKGNADVVMISETKLDDTFPVDQFVLEGFSKPFRVDRNKNGGCIFSCSWRHTSNTYFYRKGTHWILFYWA